LMSIEAKNTKKRPHEDEDETKKLTPDKTIIHKEKKPKKMSDPEDSPFDEDEEEQEEDYSPLYVEPKSDNKGKNSKANIDEDEDDLGLAPVKKDDPKKPAINVDHLKTTGGSAMATKRLVKDLQLIHDLNPKEAGFEGGPVDDNLYHWKLKLFGFDEASELAKDMKIYKQRTGQDFIDLEVTFPNDYPFSPPFIRVVKPRFRFHTGHVTVGGSICMELLTNSGWAPTNNIESVLVQIRSEMLMGGGRLDLSNPTPYTEYEAKQAFQRVAKDHGWIK